MNRLRLACLALSIALAAPAAAQVKTWPSERPPHQLPAHDVRFPPYEFRTLPNGLQVIAVPHHEEPAVSLRLIVRAGSVQDPEGKPGVAALAASLMDQGTTTRSAEEIASAIDSIGGALGTGAGADLSFVNAIVMKDSLNVGLDLVSDLVQHPAFAAEEIERQRQQTLSALKVSYDDPEYLANMVFDRLVYGFNPYGRPQNGTPESVATITRGDLVAFHKKWFGANNAILAIVGDVAPEEAFAGAARAFGAWAPAEAQAAKLMEPPAPARRLVIIDRPGAVQTEIRVGNIAIPRKHDDFMALDLAIKVLGGEGANRLHRVLRSERGLTYGASADLTALKQAGDIEATTNTRSATTGETLRLMVDEFWRLMREEPGERELAGAQEYLTGSFPLTIETPSQIATQILNAVFFGLDLKDLQTYRDRVNAVRPEDVQRVARQYLHPDRLTIVLVGDASAFVDQLKGSGFDKYERISVADLDLSAADLRRKDSHANGGRDPEGRADYTGHTDLAPRYQTASYRMPAADDPKALIAKAIAAKGGLAKLRSIRTVRAEQTTTVQDAQGHVVFPSVVAIAYPDQFRMDADMPGGKVTQVYDRGSYWLQEPKGVADVTAEGGRMIRAGLQRDTISLLLACASGTLTLAPAEADAPLAGVVVSGPELTPVTLFINRDTGLIERMRYASPAGVVTEEFSDYRDVDGIQVAFHAVVRRPGAPVMERDVKKLHFNVPLPAGLFSKPS
jgi:zinc protease